MYKLLWAVVDLVLKVYQERLLSPRMLHFADEELIWECDQAVHCECGSEKTREEFGRTLICTKQGETSVGNMESLSQQTEALRSWYRVVEDYISSSFTYSKDAFPALSGIAKVFMADLQDEYVAGMWRHTLVSQLLWYFKPDPGLAATKTEPWRAPSWSWACMDWTPGFITLPVTEELAEVRSIVCEPSGLDPTGELESANLSLRTKVVPASMELRLEEGRPRYELRFGDEFVMTQAYIPVRYNLDYAETGFFALSDERLNDGITCLPVAVAQIASWLGRREVRTPNSVYFHVKTPDEVRLYLLLARDATHLGCCVRIGLVLITAYDPDLTLCPWPHLLRMRCEEIEKELEKNGIQKSELFDLFDKSEEVDITIW